MHQLICDEGIFTFVDENTLNLHLNLMVARGYTCSVVMDTDLLPVWEEEHQDYYFESYEEEHKAIRYLERNFHSIITGSKINHSDTTVAY